MEVFLTNITRFGPNRVAADMEGNVEFGFWVIYEYFGGFLERVKEILGNFELC